MHSQLGLAPVQAEIIPVNNEAHGEYAEKVRQELAKRGFRVEVDDRNEKMGYKIRESPNSKSTLHFSIR